MSLGDFTLTASGFFDTALHPLFCPAFGGDPGHLPSTHEGIWGRRWGGIRVSEITRGRLPSASIFTQVISFPSPTPSPGSDSRIYPAELAAGRAGEESLRSSCRCTPHRLKAELRTSGWQFPDLFSTLSRNPDSPVGKPAVQAWRLPGSECPVWSTGFIRRGLRPVERVRSPFARPAGAHVSA